MSRAEDIYYEIPLEREKDSKDLNTLTQKNCNGIGHFKECNEFTIRELEVWGVVYNQ